MREGFCKDCGDNFIQYRSTQNRCDTCAYEKMIKTSKKQVRTIVKHRGKKTIEWLDIVRPKWIRTHPPNEHGYWECYLGLTKQCRRWLSIEYLTLDHVKPRGSNPSQRNHMKNIRPACKNCNYLKGSMSLASVKKKYPMSRIALGVESDYGF
jgi:5-methylcytosine-specific restriction endonuclease McrA